MTKRLFPTPPERLSRDDEPQDESNGISNQEELCRG